MGNKVHTPFLDNCRKDKHFYSTPQISDAIFIIKNKKLSGTVDDTMIEVRPKYRMQQAVELSFFNQTYQIRFNT